ncbi:MAG: type I DNA topoisomerase [Eubacterium sp.]|nr:type I DNA topoisomerase [Eubacterium sp.]
MAKNLVIVESPTKVNTVKKFLGNNYEVMASLGHVRDLPKSTLGIDVDGDFDPKYITIRGKGELLASLRNAVKKADKVYLATDPDREGEAISWHLSKALNLEPKKFRRITFNEITKNAVKDSIKNARDIDMNLVDEQQARRCLDRMVGYEISPLLWEKVKRGLSAGRVQSAALRIIADRENDINAFIPDEYWSLEADFEVADAKKPLIARYTGRTGGRQELTSKEETDAVISAVDGESFRVMEVKTGTRVKKPPLPFTTSTLQQEASRSLNFSTVKTMRIAQQLYEGVEIKGQGFVGLITYLRTDSTRISEEAEAAAISYIKDNYGTGYLPDETDTDNKNKNAQDAHEAIRPTDIARTPAAVHDSLSRDQYRLYQLIWKRFLASRMANAVYENVNAKLSAKDYNFTATSSRVSFDGFLSVYNNDEEKEEKNVALAGLKKDMVLTPLAFRPEQHFTQPPAHFTEASLVKAMEEMRIGRPSTYAPTISTLLQRRYIVKENKNLYITELGEVVNKVMKEAFPSIVDVNFTAGMEELLDYVGEGQVDWKNVLRNFWPDLKSAVDSARSRLEKITVDDEVSEEKCELCGRQMVIKYGPFGKFLACPGFPECKNTKPFMEKIGVPCPKCGKEVVIRRTRKGRRYYGCENNPECDFMSWKRPES